MTRVLITGVAGFNGAHALKHFLDSTDWEIIGVDSLAHNGDYRRVEQMVQFAKEKNPTLKPKFTFIKTDLASVDPKDFARQVGKVDYIINMAAATHIDRSIEEPARLITNNVSLCVNMLEVARIIRPKTFIHVSTDEVYGPVYDQTHAEWSPEVPSNPYSASAAAQEMIAISYWRTYGVPVIITNSATTFGEMQDSGKFLPTLVRNITHEKTVKIYAVEQEIGSHSYLHARNHANALLYIIENLPATNYDPSTSRNRPDRYNISGPWLSNLEMARRVAEVLKRPLKYKFVDSHTIRPGHDLHYGLDGTKLQDLGWRPPMSFEEGLRLTVTHYLDHPEWEEWGLGLDKKD